MSPSTDAPDDLPPAVPALWRTFLFGYRAEPRLLLASLGTTLLMMLPDALLALWLKLLTDGVLDGDRTAIVIGRRRPRRVGDGHVVRQRRQRAAVAALPRPAGHRHGGPHRPPPGDGARPSSTRSGPSTSTAWPCCATSRSPSTTCSRRCSATSAGSSGSSSRRVLLASIHPALALLLLAGLPAVLTSLWRPGVERAVEESVAAHDRLARHLFVVGTTPAPAKEVRVTGIGDELRARRRAARERWQRPDRRGPLGVGGVDVGWPGRSSASPTRSASPGWRAASTAASATSSSSSSPASACRSTSPRRSASSASCAACGSTRRCA